MIAFCSADRNSGVTSEEFGTPAKYLFKFWKRACDKTKARVKNQKNAELTVVLEMIPTSGRSLTLH